MLPDVVDTVAALAWFVVNSPVGVIVTEPAVLLATLAALTTELIRTLRAADNAPDVITGPLMIKSPSVPAVTIVAAVVGFNVPAIVIEPVVVANVAAPLVTTAPALMVKPLLAVMAVAPKLT
jgi:hypothetical protein